ncbi:phosphotransferase [Polyangium aurulentum]|uniref:phosphotransferase n=1 Tax=Polyangium aurulentum TaxID=2567896 RepID=UPI0010AE28CC|nr:phosphotransferase [Polyangium aurulentum]UQA56446.1 phosphotransferase [Polyangium aurulentum]
MFADPRAVFPTDRLGEIRDITPLTLGMSGAQVHAVTTDKGAYVVRIQGPDAPGFERVLALYRLVSDHGVAPRLVHVDEAARCTVTEKISGVLFAQAFGAPETRGAAMGSLVERLATLHSIPVSDLKGAVAPVLSPREVWNEHSQRPGFPAWALPLGKRLEEAEALLAADPRRVLCHCDLNPGNMLWDGKRVWLLDWDVASLQHPYTDLATFSNFVMLPDDAAFGLAAAEQGAPLTPEQKKTFLALRDVMRIVFGCIFLRFVPDLQAVAVPSREEAPTLAEVYAGMQTGAIDLKSADGQVRMACAVLAQVH